jgi:hypothetical protein
MTDKEEIERLRCPDCGWSLPRFDCPHQGCNGVALHKRARGTRSQVSETAAATEKEKR